MIHRRTSARVKRGTNIMGNEDRTASVPSVTKKEEKIVAFNLKGGWKEKKLENYSNDRTGRGLSWVQRGSNPITE